MRTCHSLRNAVELPSLPSPCIGIYAVAHVPARMDRCLNRQVAACAEAV